MTTEDVYPVDWHEIADTIKRNADWLCESCGVPNGPPPNMLTVHHVDLTKLNCEDYNLVALCQRCHLVAQGWHFIPRSKTNLLRILKQREGQLALPLVLSTE